MTLRTFRMGVLKLFVKILIFWSTLPQRIVNSTLMEDDLLSKTTLDGSGRRPLMEVEDNYQLYIWQSWQITMIQQQQQQIIQWGFAPNTINLVYMCFSPCLLFPTGYYLSPPVPCLLCSTCLLTLLILRKRLQDVWMEWLIPINYVN